MRRGGVVVSEPNVTLGIMTEGWQTYQQKLIEALAPLSAEQLALRAAPSLRSIEQIARHMVSVRAGWFHRFLGEGGDDFGALATWDAPESSVRPAEELVQGLTLTWQVLQETLARYTPTDLQETIERKRYGQTVRLTRGWVVWHLIEHDLHHGGELSFSLGMHGLTAPDL
jgi:uncharacterized damage-inducible protein DinB